jgi:hypothetical protein
MPESNRPGGSSIKLVKTIERERIRLENQKAKVYPDALRKAAHRAVCGEMKIFFLWMFACERAQGRNCATLPTRHV